MSKKINIEDLESTVRLDSSKVTDPYDEPAIDNIDDIFSTDKDNSTDFDATLGLPREAFISMQETIDFDALTKEMNELSDEFDLDSSKQKDTKQDSNIKIEKTTAKTQVDIPELKEEIPTEALDHAQSIVEDPITPKVSQRSEKPKKTLKHTSKPLVQTNNKTTKSSNSISVAMLMISLIALIAGIVGIWSGISSQTQIDTLSKQVNTLHNGHLDNQSDIITLRDEITSLKQTLADFKAKPNLLPPSQTKSEPSQSTVTKITPAVITPATPIKESKPQSKKTLTNTWTVVISSHNSLKKAKLEQQKQLAKGIQTSIASVTVKGGNWYRIVATGFADKQQAIRFTQKLKKQGITDAWVQFNK